MIPTSHKKRRFVFAGLITVFFILSVAIGIYLVKQQQLISKKAFVDGRPWCDSSYGQNDKCQYQATTCQEDNNGDNTGWLCTCVDLSPNTTCNRTVWNCEVHDTDACPAGDSPPTNTLNQCTPYNTKIEGRCFVSLNGQPISAAVFHYRCPNVFSAPDGCQDNQTIENQQLNLTTVCFDTDFCGIQQMDIGPECFMSVPDFNCNTPAPSLSPTRIPSPTPTRIPTPTLTRTSTPIPTPTITPSPIPTVTPINTPTITITPTLTIIPTQTPTLTTTPTVRLTPTSTPIHISTPTPGPTSTPTPTSSYPYVSPTPVLKYSPSPTPTTQLPQSGFALSSITISLAGVILIALGLLLAL